MTTEVDSRMWTRDSLAEFLEVEMVPRARSTLEPIPSERALSESLGVSRSLVREVLRGLEQRGLIEIVPGKGAYARHPSSAGLARTMRSVLAAKHSAPDDLVEARASLETQTAALAALRATTSDIEAISRALDDFASADSLALRAAAEISFHALIARASHNAVLSTIFDSISTMLFESMIRSLADGGTRSSGADTHRAIFKAIADGDGEGAEVAMRKHIDTTSHPHVDADERLDRLVADVLARTYGPGYALEDIVEEALQRYDSDRPIVRGSLR